MEWYEVELNGRRTVSFPARASLPRAVSDAGDDCVAPSKIGSVIKRGEWAWLASGGVLEVVALRTGQSVSTYEFTDSSGYNNCCIRCVEEVFVDGMESMLLAVCLESFRAAGGGCSFVALYSVADSKVLSCMELQLHVTGACFVGANCCRRSLLQNFDGCLALGSEEGVVVLLDLNLNKVLDVQMESKPINTPSGCQITDYNLPLADIHCNFRQCRRDGMHFGLQIEVIDTPCAIQCLLPIDLILGLAIGLEDGRLAFYDLAELQIFYIALPQPQQAMSSLVKMTYLEPLDDPRACLYLCAVHESDQQLSATVHALMYEKRLMDEDAFCYFESFQTGAVRLQLPLEATKSALIACQSINKVPTASRRADDDANCLCALFWYSPLEEKNKLLLFDLNQWYKEEMPNIIDCQKHPSYLAGYILNGRQCGLDAYLNPSTIAHFNSLQRFEEHFYPNSLSFDCVLLVQDCCRSYTWMGAQNKLVNILRSSSASIFLEPDACFREILRARLMPQFSELNANSNFSQNAKYETILSVALEHNCFSLLRDCARCWADGSFMGGNFTASTGISLSTLTEWIWKRATNIKTRCNDLCKGLFDYAGYPLDQREQKELGFITRQLKLLADLLGELLTFSKRHIPDKVLGSLHAKFKSMRMASEYQEIIQWLLNIGLLPETAARYSHSYSAYKPSSSNNATSILYPHAELKKMYTLKRAFFAKIGENLISKKTGSCRLLFIDAFIEHECKGDALREFWLENGGNGLYPPTSIESMLHVMLVPDVPFESKCAILLYFFLDLHTAIDEQAHKELVASFIKFPSVFKLTASLIKTVQAFWNLDRGHFLPAVDEFISPFHNNQNYPQWMLELLIESLLTQNASNLALRILEARPNLISPVLKLKTLLSNDLIAEAFHFARSKHDESLLELFFTCCLCAGKYGVIRDLALSEKEGQLVQRILRRSKTHGAENLHFVYLLQKSKYIEAVSYLDELSRTKSVRSHYADGNVSTDTPTLVLSAFNTTMAPVTQGLTDVYFRIRNKIKKKETDNNSPVPLSCQLIKQNANNLLGGIYHSSALSAHFATYYWGEMDAKKTDGASLLNSNNAPFLRKPQTETHYMDFAEPSSVSYPQPYKVAEKRTLTESELPDNDDPVLERSQSLLSQNPKKRRRLLGKEIVNDLSHFVDMNRNSGRLNASGFNLAQTSATIPRIVEADTGQPTTSTDGLSTPKRSTVERSSTEFLTQPLATPRRRLTVDPNVSSYTAKSFASAELHGILKTNTPERAERGCSARRDLPSDESKNLRFNLPKEAADKRESIEEDEDEDEDENEDEKEDVKEKELEKGYEITDTSAKAYRSTPTNIDATGAITATLNDEDEEALEVIVEINPADLVQISTERIKQTVRAVSVDSNDSEDSLENSDMVEDFYSPVSSQQNSMVVDSPRSPMVVNSAEPDSADSAKRRYGFLSGPQPRKPLMRLSAESTEEPLTPESQPQTESKVNVDDNNRHRQQRHHHIFDIKTPTSSGYLSLDKKNSGTSAVSARGRTSFETSIKSLANRLTTFTPKSSSSKVGESQSNFAAEKMPSRIVKLSERSTVVDSFTFIEEVATNEVTPTETTHTDVASAVGGEEHKMLDTTLGMSSYDLTTADTMVLAPDEMIVTEVEYQRKEAEREARDRQDKGRDEVNDLYEDMQFEEHVTGLGDSDLFGEVLGLQSAVATSNAENYNVQLEVDQHSDVESNAEVTAEPNENDDKAEDEDVVIVLSSGSSSESVGSECDGLDEREEDSESEYEEEAESIDSIEADDDEGQDDEEYAEEEQEEELNEGEYENEAPLAVDVDDYADEVAIGVDEYADSDPEGADKSEAAYESHSPNSSNLVVNVEYEEVVQMESLASSDDDSDEKPNSIKSDDTEENASKKEPRKASMILTEKIIEELSTDSVTVVSSEEVVIEQNEEHANRQEQMSAQDAHDAKLKDQDVIIGKIEESTYSQKGQEIVNETENVVAEVSSEKTGVTSTNKTTEMVDSEKQTMEIMESVPVQLIEGQAKLKDQDVIIGKIEENTYSQKGQEIVNEIENVVPEVSSEKTGATSTNETAEMVDSEKQTMEIMESVPAQLMEGQAEIEIPTDGNTGTGSVEKSQDFETTDDRLTSKGNEKTPSASPKSETGDQPSSSTNIVAPETDLYRKEMDKEVVDKDTVAEDEEQISLHVQDEDMSDNEVHEKPEAGGKDASMAAVKVEAVSTLKQPGAEQSPIQDSDHTPRKRNRLSEMENVGVSTPHMRRALRGSSVPSGGVELNTQVDIVITAHRGSRSISMSPHAVSENDDGALHTPHTKRKTQSILLKTDEAVPDKSSGTPRRRRNVQGLLVEEDENSGTPRARRRVRSTSVPHEVQGLTVEEDEHSGTPRRRGNVRGTSVPHEVQGPVVEEDENSGTPRSHRRVRSTSVQHEVQDLTVEEDEHSGTPRRRGNVRGTSAPHEVQTIFVIDSRPVGRGTSVPPAGVAAKVTGRRRSTLLDVISEDSPVLDSPSTRTRSRMRLNSMESEMDASIVSGEQPEKRTRRTSLSSSVSEQTQTPKRRRRASVTASQEESTASTPKSMRGSKRRQSTDVNLTEEDIERKKAGHDGSVDESHDDATTSSAIYSSSRRLTRTQLAMMEKSAALNKLVAERQSDVALISPPIAKRVSKRRSSRATASTVHDSDDVESISSHASNVSNLSKRRVTRSSVKDKREDMDDDLVSIASSVGSERVQKRRSREDKNSPNITLTTIPEDEEEEEVVPKKRGRPPKKTHV